MEMELLPSQLPHFSSNESIKQSFVLLVRTFGCRREVEVLMEVWCLFDARCFDRTRANRSSNGCTTTTFPHVKFAATPSNSVVRFGGTNAIGYAFQLYYHMDSRLPGSLLCCFT